MAQGKCDPSDSDQILQSLPYKPYDHFKLDGHRVDIGSTEQVSQWTQLLSLLILFDVLQDIYPEFTAMRDYAIWQGAAQVYGLSKFEGISGISFRCLYIHYILLQHTIPLEISCRAFRPGRYQCNTCKHNINRFHNTFQRRCHDCYPLAHDH